MRHFRRYAKGSDFTTPPLHQRRGALVAVSPEAGRGGRFTTMRVTADAPLSVSMGNTAADVCYMRHRIPNPEEYYFSRGDSVCRLCHEYVPPSQINFHVYGSGPRGPATHIGREIVLDSLIFHARRGFDPAAVVREWPYVLARCTKDVRIPDLWPNDLSDLPERCRRLTALLRTLKSLGVLNISVSPHSETTSGSSLIVQRMAVKRRIAFERLECIGDNAWGNHMGSRMMRIFHDKGWEECRMFHSFNTMRDIAETNSNLERLFDLLQLSSLLPPGLRDLVGEGKMKADVFESIIGELDMFIYGVESNMWGVVEYTEVNGERLDGLCTLVRHTLNEIYDLTLLTLLFGFAEHGIALAREIAQSALSFARRPELDEGTDIRTRRPVYRDSYQPQFTLPAAPHIFPGPFASARAPKSLELYGPAVNGTRARVVRPRLAALHSKLVVASEFEIADGTARGQEELGKISIDSEPHVVEALQRAMSPPRGLLDQSSSHFRRLRLDAQKVPPTSTSSGGTSEGGHDTCDAEDAFALTKRFEAALFPPFSTAAPSAAALAARKSELAAASHRRDVQLPFRVLSSTLPFPVSPLLRSLRDAEARCAIAGPPVIPLVCRSWDDADAAAEMVDEGWRRLWSTPLAERLFSDDVDPAVVLAQYEASRSMRHVAPADRTEVPDDVVDGGSSDAEHAVSGEGSPKRYHHRFAEGLRISAGEGRTLLHMTEATARLLSRDTSSESKETTGSLASTVTGTINLEEIKRRNQRKQQPGTRSRTHASA